MRFSFMRMALSGQVPVFQEHLITGGVDKHIVQHMVVGRGRGAVVEVKAGGEKHPLAVIGGHRHGLLRILRADRKR